MKATGDKLSSQRNPEQLLHVSTLPAVLVQTRRQSSPSILPKRGQLSFKEKRLNWSGLPIFQIFINQKYQKIKVKADKSQITRLQDPGLQKSSVTMLLRSPSSASRHTDPGGSFGKPLAAQRCVDSN